MPGQSLITTDPETLGGTPVFAGTRVPIVSLLQHLKAGETLDDFLDGFPSVTRRQAEAVLVRQSK
jgi:uncharacterized protein (DUF433 family)